MKRWTKKEYNDMIGHDVRDIDTKEVIGTVTGTKFPCGLESSGCSGMFFVRRLDGSQFGSDSYSFCEDYELIRSEEHEWIRCGE